MGSCTRAVSTPSGSKPSGADVIAHRLRARSPAPTRRLRESAICAATSTPRSRRERRPSLEPRDSSRSVPCGSQRPAASAGASPNASAGEQRDEQGRGQGAAVQRQVRVRRQRRERQAAQRRQPDRRQEEAGRGAGEGEQHALGEQLPHQPAAPGAQRHAHGELLAPRDACARAARRRGWRR